MLITEAERQVLIALIELSEPIETPNNTHYTFYPKTLDDAAAYFLNQQTDWQTAYAPLAQRGWIQQTDAGWVLSDRGKAAARQERRDHPPIWYWYRQYYTLTEHSPAYSRFCTELYGRDLCQTNFSDMDQLDFMIKVANLSRVQRVLDLGCGRGSFAEYLSDQTGARVWGVDYIPEAIQQALARTKPKRDRLDFSVGNFDHLDLAGKPFDLITAIDTLYMPNDLAGTLTPLKDMLAPGGQLLTFYTSMCFDPAQPRDILEPDGTDLACALRAAGFSYQTWDFSEAALHLMRRKHQLALDMRSDFDREGTLFLWNHLMAEADGGETPFDRGTTYMTRYLYAARPAPLAS